MKPQAKAIIVQRGAAKDLRLFGDVISVLLGGEQTGGTFTLMHGSAPPGGGPPPHVHANEDELFLLIEGRVSIFANDCWTEVGPGGAVYLPRGVVHSFRNIGTTPSQHWIIGTPSGLEKFFGQCAEEFGKAGGPDRNRIVEIGRQHGIQFVEKTES
jgi:mannose-6-phosphate isomerase-like protein (cupin superfamily)